MEPMTYNQIDCSGVDYAPGAACNFPIDEDAFCRYIQEQDWPLEFDRQQYRMARRERADSVEYTDLFPVGRLVVPNEDQEIAALRAQQAAQRAAQAAQAKVVNINQPQQGVDASTAETSVAA